MATGGGRRARGAMSNWLTIDNNTGRPKDGAMMTPDGLFDYERAMACLLYTSRQRYFRGRGDRETGIRGPAT